MSLISPNFDVKLIFFFPILARGLFPKLLEKALNLVEAKDLRTHENNSLHVSMNF